MILYYALGGGLGHIARSFALVEHAPKSLKGRIRLLVSSKSSPAAEPGFPCPVDRVPDTVMNDVGRYPRFLADYFKKHKFACIVVDTFPFGLLGEMKYFMPDVPRILIGRYLRWDVYHDMCGTENGAIWPNDSIVIEEQEKVYDEILHRHSSVTKVCSPISAARPSDAPVTSARPALSIVHSGSKAEMSRLMAEARRIMADNNIPGPPRVITPETKIFPVERNLSGITDIVAGAGYASCAAALVLKGRVRYHLYPFRRRYDDQALRLKRLTDATWTDGAADGASRISGILWSLADHHI